MISCWCSPLHGDCAVLNNGIEKFLNHFHYRGLKVAFVNYLDLLLVPCYD